MSLVKKFKTVVADMFLKTKNRKKNYDYTALENYRLPINAPENYLNSYYCFGYAKDGHSFFARLTFRGEGKTELLFAIRIPGKGMYTYNDSITNADGDKDEKPDQRSSMPLNFSYNEPSKKWKIRFNAPIKHINSKNEHHDLLFEGLFYSRLAMFNSHKNTLPLAKLLANKKWNKHLFSNFKKIDVVETEQGGFFKGKYIFDNKEETVLEMNAMRTHTYGSMDPSLFDRCISLLVAFDNGAYLCYNVVDFSFLKGIKNGFYIDTNTILPVMGGTSIEELTTDRQLSPNFDFEVILEGKIHVKGTCSLNESFYEREKISEITEGLAEFAFNGYKGHGIVSNISQN